MEKTINEVFSSRVKKYGDRLAVEKKIKGRWDQATWNEYYEKARAAGLGLYELGIRKGDRIALLADNRLEWLYSDMGALGIGAVVVPIYTTLSADEVEYIVKHSDSKVFIVEDQCQHDKAVTIKDKCPDLSRVVVMDTDNVSMNDFTITFDELMELGRKKYQSDPELFEKLADDVTREDLASIVYTSGTTGPPKGAMMSHKNIMAQIEALDAVRPKYAFDDDQTVPFLPLSHVFERIAGHFYGMYVGLTSSYAEKMDTIVQDIQEKRPTVVLAVPRVCEKVYSRITMQVKEQPAWKQKVFHWGQKIGQKISERREMKKRIPLFLRFKYKIAYIMIFKKLAMALGGRVRWMTASGAPTAKEIVHFFNGAGIMVVEGYGMTELTAPATMSNLADYRIGSAGTPLPGFEVKIADDGEILVKGDHVVQGYWKQPEVTKESFTADGYFKTGDIGIIDSDGFLYITDRKKDIMITSGGKNVAPQNVENLFKSDPLFTQCIVIGDGKKYLTCLFNIDPAVSAGLADEKGIKYDKPEDLADNPEFLKIVDEHVQEKNSHLAKFETVKKYRIVKHEFSQDSGELTATMKVKRKVVYDVYKDLIDEMYAEPDEEGIDKKLYQR